MVFGGRVRGKREVGRAVSAREATEVVIERVVLLDDDHHVLDLVVRYWSRTRVRRGPGSWSGDWLGPGFRFWLRLRCRLRGRPRLALHRLRLARRLRGFLDWFPHPSASLRAVTAQKHYASGGIGQIAAISRRIVTTSLHVSFEDANA